MSVTTYTISIVVVISWILLFWGLFLFEKLDKRVHALRAQQDAMQRMLKAIAEKLDVDIAANPLLEEVINLHRQGKTYEAMVLYRKRTGSSVKQAQAFIDSLQDTSVD